MSSKLRKVYTRGRDTIKCKGLLSGYRSPWVVSGPVGALEEPSGSKGGRAWPPSAQRAQVGTVGESPILKSLSILSPDLGFAWKQGFSMLGPPRMSGPPQAVPALYQALGC